jgi:hypothetical protein
MIDGSAGHTTNHNKTIAHTSADAVGGAGAVLEQERAGAAGRRSAC